MVGSKYWSKPRLVPMKPSIIIALGVMLLLLGAGIWWIRMQVSPQSPVPRAPGTEAAPPIVTLEPKKPSIPEGWKDYANPRLGLTLAHDPTLTVSEEADGSVRFWKWGPTQKGQTEMYDGIIVSFRKVDFTESLDTFLAGRMKEFQEVGTITEPLATRDFNGLPAKTFSASSLGDFEMIYVPLDADTVMEISTMAPDPTQAGFQKTVEQMLATVNIAQ